jgi:hypothetical protein
VEALLIMQVDFAGVDIAGRASTGRPSPLQVTFPQMLSAAKFATACTSIVDITCKINDNDS